MVLFTEQEIQSRVQTLALEISFKDNPENKPRVMIGVLNGAFMFFSDLVRNLKVDCEVDFIQAKSYLGQTQHEIKILKDIKTKINKNLVYGIKNKDNNYRIEIYLYGKEPNELNYQNKNNNKFINDVNKLLQYFNHNIENKINKIFNDRNVILVSFDIDLQGNFNNKIHLYVKSNIDDEIINHINFIKTSNYTLDYDIIKDTIEDESFFTRINNFEELKTVLNYYKNIKGYKINIDYFMKELLKINAKSTNLMFHYKFYNNSIGIYFIDNHINIVNNFLKIYDYPFKIDESIYKKLKLDIAINYIINENRINGTGFSDFI
jgi:hypoxanthine phosphoribosyltransferase